MFVIASEVRQSMLLGFAAMDRHGLWPRDDETWYFCNFYLPDYCAT